MLFDARLDTIRIMHELRAPCNNTIPINAVMVCSAKQPQSGKASRSNSNDSLLCSSRNWQHLFLAIVVYNLLWNKSHVSATVAFTADFGSKHLQKQVDYSYYYFRQHHGYSYHCYKQQQHENRCKNLRPILGMIHEDSATTENNGTPSSNTQEPKNGSIHHICAVGGPRAHVYGEMTQNGLRQMCDALVTMKQLTERTPTRGAQEVFLDLGSGNGGLVLKVATDFEHCFLYAMGIELSTDRHETAVQSWQKAPPVVQSRATFVQGDAAGDDAVPLIQQATVIWCSNLLFDNTLLQRIANSIASSSMDSPSLHTVVSLKEFPQGIAGFRLLDNRLPLEMSWTAGKHQPGHPPLPGHPCCVYTLE